MSEMVQSWIRQAEYDWETVSSMMSGGRYLYVAFMCEQAVEKLLKGIIQHRTGSMPPYTHNLTALARESQAPFSEDQLNFLTLLTGYYINTRYPDYKQRLAKEIDEQKAKEIMRKSEDIYRCLKKELPT